MGVLLHGYPRGAGRTARDGLFPALRRLDRLLERATAAARDAFGPGAFADPYRGLAVTADEVERLLAREAGAPAFLVCGDTDEACLAGEPVGGASLAWLARRFDLSCFDLDIVLIALAPEIDLRYERLYAYLQDDVTRRRPSVDLALNLLGASADERLARRRHFVSDAPLFRNGLARLEAEPNHSPSSSLALAIALDGQVVRLLLDLPGLDSRLAGFCRLLQPGELEDGPSLDPQRDRALATLTGRAQAERTPLRLYFQGPRGAGCRRAAARLAGQLVVNLLTVDLAAALAADPAFAWVPGVVTREAAFQGAILYLDGWDALDGDDQSLPRRRLAEALGSMPEVTIVAGPSPWPSGAPDVTAVPFDRPDFARRRAAWESSLGRAGVAVDGARLDGLAGRFKLGAGQIAAAVASARNQARWLAAREGRPESAAAPATGDLFGAARAQSGHELASLARKVEPRAAWDDLVLPDDALAQLREIAQRVALQYRVWDDWGFGRGPARGRGVNALFAGPPGTGKTMAAEVLAGELGLALYKIDLSRVVSKWVGETEKHLDCLFTAAEDSNAILLFDEADALFGKRSEVRDAHDRYANIETSYLLQKMEQYEGVALLATNMLGNLDEAFTRRLAFTVHFPFPDEAMRLRLWCGVWPHEVPLADDVDFAALAARFKLSGAHVKNVALAAAFLAAADGGPVRASHLLHAVRREYQKMGKVLSDAELRGDPGRPRP
ncbi:MAG TPA: ATP-binding protein [Gemmataceae bacterium]|nr:ATP-binding protein [Gemmataceae bacterium]